ncbi:MAG: PEP-CTERM sorting domain-containing protein [Isosphaeraceae bacterium]
MRRILGPVLIPLLVSAWLPLPVRAGSIVVGHRISEAARQREIARNEQFFKQLSSLRESQPARFDRLHPFYGQLLTSSTFFDRYFQRWQANPARFEFYHPCAWKVLDGGAHLHPPGQGETPVPPPLPEGSNPPVTPPLPPINPPEPGPLPPLTPSVVPEPSSLILAASGMGLLLLAGAARRRSR